MTHVSNYAQTRSLGSAAFARKNNELSELTNYCNRIMITNGNEIWKNSKIREIRCCAV